MRQQRTVMIVEDEPAIRGLLSMTLEAEDYRVETAADGREALERVRHHPPDAILLDLVLPYLDGPTLIRTLDDDPSLQQIPVVAVSATERYPGVGERGVYAFLSKPFDVETLLTILDDALVEHEARRLVTFDDRVE
ncbi:MAG: response regulator [Chloroflexi bacterium]|nr:response regulator [Chloroflexota bacterium]